LSNLDTGIRDLAVVVVGTAAGCVAIFLLVVALVALAQ
jgi:hypothetical protein